MKFERGKKAKEAMNIGARKDAIVIQSMSRHFFNHKKGKMTASSWTQEDLNPILIDLSNCILPEFEFPYESERYNGFKVHDITFHIIIPPDHNREDIRPLLLVGHTLVWKDKFYHIPDTEDSRWDPALLH